MKTTPRLNDANKEAAIRGTSGDVSGLDLAPLTASLGYLLRRLQLSYKKHFSRTAGTDGIPVGHVGPMFAIGLNPGVTPTQLGTALGMDAAHVTATLNHLELKRLIKRKSSKVDGRSRAVHLTAGGEREFQKIRRAALEAEQSFLGALSDRDAAKLVELMSRLLVQQPE